MESSTPPAPPPDFEEPEEVPIPPPEFEPGDTYSPPPPPPPPIEELLNDLALPPPYQEPTVEHQTPNQQSLKTSFEESKNKKAKVSTIDVIHTNAKAKTPNLTADSNSNSFDEETKQQKKQNRSSIHIVTHSRTHNELKDRPKAISFPHGVTPFQSSPDSPYPLVDNTDEDYGTFEDLPLPKLPDDASPILKDLNVPKLSSTIRSSSRSKKEETLYLSTHDALVGGTRFLETQMTLDDICNQVRKSKALLKMVVKCQAIVRGWVIRKRKNSTSKQKVTFFIAFMEKEVKFMHRMKCFKEFCIAKLAAQKFKNLDIVEFNKIVQLWKFIYDCQVEILTILRKIEINRHPFYDGVANICTVFTSNFSRYGAFLDQSRVFCSLFRRLQIQSPEFDAAYKEIITKDPSLTFHECFLLPVQHVHDYVKAFRHLLSATSAHSTDHKQLLYACERISLIEEYIRKGNSLTYNPLFCLNLYERIGNVFSPKIPENIARSHIYNFECLLLSKGSTVYNCVILSDKTLLLKDKYDKKSGACYEIYESFPTDSIFSFENEKNVWKIKLKDKKMLRFSFTDVKHETIFRPLVSEIVSQIGKGHVPIFGTSLEAVCLTHGHTDYVPSFFIDLCSFLMNFTEATGLFHQEPFHDDFDRLVSKFTSNPRYQLLISVDDPYCVSKLLKHFLRNLNPTLFPQTFYDEFIDLDICTDDQVFVEHARALLAKIPISHFRTLSYLISFFRSFLAKSKANVFKLNALGVMYGLTLIRPQTDTIETTKDIPKITAIVCRIIDEAANLDLIKNE